MAHKIYGRFSCVAHMFLGCLRIQEYEAFNLDRDRGLGKRCFLTC